jgi:hypothetical protein
MEDNAKTLTDMLLYLSVSLTVMTGAIETILEETRAMQQAILSAAHTIAKNHDDGHLRLEA